MWSNKIRKTYSQLNESKKVVLKEEWKTNGTLEEWNPKDLIDKAMSNRYATNTIREYDGMKLYINVDPGFLFGTRKEDAGIWLNIVEIDANNNQERIYLEKASDENDAEEKLLTWKQEYMG